MNSFDINHTINDNKNLGQYAENTIPDNTMLQLSCKFDESKWNSYWVNMLTSSSGTNYVISENEDFGQYSLYAIPSEVMACYSYPASLVNQLKSLLTHRVNELVW